jgi:hypothetical protein
MMPGAAAWAAMAVAAVVGMVAGLLTLHVLGQPTPFSR